MKMIGVTGGVGSGKSTLLEYVKEHFGARILLADQIANELKLPGECCYEPVVDLLGREILDDDEKIDNQKMAAKIFSDRHLLTRVNEIIHPAVNTYIQQEIQKEKEKGSNRFLFLEAALFIECGYQKMVDAVWYIYADDEVRRARLKQNRGYSNEKITQIMKSQLPEEVFRQHADVVIDNSKNPEYAFKQIDKTMEGYLWEK